MTTYFVSRHEGALEWAQRQGIEATALSHLDPDSITPGDRVIGALPVHIAAQICARGGHYCHLTLNLPPEARGRELSANEMTALGARICEYVVRKG